MRSWIMSKDLSLNQEKNMLKKLQSIWKGKLGIKGILKEFVILHNIPTLRKEIDKGNLKPLRVQQQALLNQRGFSL